MTTGAKNMLRQLALKVYADPTATARERQLARGFLLLVDGRLPQ
jgi:hypothetical protein